MDISINNSRELGTGGSQSEREPARIVRAGGSPGLKLVNLALQGGGAHGAFASGALDRLLEEKRIAFDGISVTSAAAINATVLAAGLAEGGRRIAHLGSLTPLQPSLADRLSGKPLSRRLFLYAIRLGDPTVLALPIQPCSTTIRCARCRQRPSTSRALRSGHCLAKLFLSATNVRTGKIKVFQNDEIGPEAVLAPSCLLFIFQAVEIGGEHYWDGGYMGNPAIFSLIYGCESRDLAIVHINPLERARLWTTASEIMNPHQRDQLQFLADARDARDRLRHQADR